MLKAQKPPSGVLSVFCIAPYPREQERERKRERERERAWDRRKEKRGEWEGEQEQRGMRFRWLVKGWSSFRCSMRE